MENQINQSNSKNKHLVAVVILVLAALGVSAYFYMQKGRMSGKEVDTSESLLTATPAPVAPSVTSEVSPSPTPASTGSSEASNVKTFTVVGSNFSFSSAEIKVKKGDKVKIIFQNADGFHDWVIDEFNVKTPRIQGGQSATVEFVADKMGTFQYYCSVGSHRANGMWGNLIVQ